MRRVFILIPFLLLVGLSIGAQTAAPTRQITSTLYYRDLEMMFTTQRKPDKRNTAKTNAALIDAVKARHLFIYLTGEERKALKGLGASKELFRSINEVIPEAEQSKVLDMNRLYMIVIDNYKSTDVKGLTLSINAAKEFLAKYGSEETVKPNVEWLRRNLPIWQLRLDRIVSSSRDD